MSMTRVTSCEAVPTVSTPWSGDDDDGGDGAGMPPHPKKDRMAGSSNIFLYPAAFR